MKYLTLMILSLFLAASSDIFAQSAPRDEDRFFYGSEVDEDMQSIVPDKSFSTEGIQYGAILSPVFLNEESKDEKLAAFVMNSKIWAKSYLWKNSYIYLGIRDSYMDVLSKKGLSNENVKSDNSFDLDLGFIAVSDNDGSLKLSAGRKYFNIGTGLVLNGRGDGAELNYSASMLSIDLLGMYTGLLVKDNNPYGLSDKDYADGAKRVFSGGIIAAALGNQNLYMFGLFQMDMAKQVKSAETKYDSQYFGAGIEGVILNISYYAETVFETGQSYITKTSVNEKSDIAAYAVNTGLNYFIPVAFNPTLILQYAYGSGDKSRDNYTTGNRPAGAEGYDKGFISFGTFSGGYALKPVLSNIHIFRAGLTIVPFASFDSMSLRKMSLGGKYSYYIKDKKASPINDGEGALPKSDIGQGIDVSLRWQIFYDASFYVNYGLFLPGAAYREKESKNFIMTGFNFSF